MHKRVHMPAILIRASKYHLLIGITSTQTRNATIAKRSSRSISSHRLKSVREIILNVLAQDLILNIKHVHCHIQFFTAVAFLTDIL